ncbi:MAG: HTTM domain-containing protein [Persicimonas sp.]
MIDKLRHKLGERVDIASLAVFRVAFGLAIVIGVVRYIGYGWVEMLYLEPEYHFTYWGFDWVQPWPGEWMYVHYIVMGVLGLFIALGLYYRASISLFFLLFTYTELIDKTAYLNHYYFISLAALLMIFMPLERGFSLDARRKPEIKSDTAPAWVLWTLRLQIGVVYFFAGLAKLQPDWLVDGQPMRIWLASKSDMWLIGPLLEQAWVAHAMSIAGAAFDLTIFFFLLWPASRAFAYVAVVIFHAATGLLFNIGLFPVIMIALTPIFFEPDWPRRVWAWAKGLVGRREVERRPHRSRSSSRPISKFLLAALAIWFAIQLLLPLRHLLYPGDVLWNQQGWRASWRVMLIEKSGHLKYEIRDPDSDERWSVYPSEFLTPRQLQLAAGTPDMILQLAHDLADDYRERGRPNVEVYAHAHVSLNANPSKRLVDPEVDLADEPRGPMPYEWVTERR